MAVQMISYDLKNPGRNYNNLYEAIKGIGSWWHCVESVWLVQTNLNSAQIRDLLRPLLDTNDLLVVLAVDENWASIGLSDECNAWLHNNVAA